jgi:hypothetical protein
MPRSEQARTSTAWIEESALSAEAFHFSSSAGSCRPRWLESSSLLPGGTIRPIKSGREGNQPNRVMVFTSIDGEAIVETRWLQFVQDFGECRRAVGIAFISHRKIEADGRSRAAVKSSRPSHSNDGLAATIRWNSAGRCSSA